MITTKIGVVTAFHGAVPVAKKDVVKKRYYRLANGNGSFNMKAFLFARKKSLLVVVHYRGDTSAIQHKPHGNRKQFLEQTHVRTMP